MHLLLVQPYLAVLVQAVPGCRISNASTEGLSPWQIIPSELSSPHLLVIMRQRPELSRVCCNGVKREISQRRSASY